MVELVRIRIFCWFGGPEAKACPSVTVDMEGFMWIGVQELDGYDHTNTNASDPIITLQLSLFG